MKEISLFAPSGAPIVGFRTKEGRTIPLAVKHFVRDGNHHFLYEIPELEWGAEAESEGDMVLVDDAGNVWSGAEVQAASIPSD